MDLTNAKIAYLLSTCPKFNEAFMSALVRKYEPSRTVASRHYFSLHVLLHEPDDGDFAVKGVYFKFANSSEPILADALQHSNNKYLSWEIPELHKNLMAQGIDLGVRQLVSLYTVAALVKMYRGHSRYIFVPVIINYGRGGNIVHQCALIVDLSGKFIFYEPYGKYSKYGKSYKKALRELFGAFSSLRLFSSFSSFPSFSYVSPFPSFSSFSSEIYHDMLGLTSGIQTIILERNNARKESFDKEFKKIVDRAVEFFGSELPPKVQQSLEDFKKPNSPMKSDGLRDLTVDILDLLFEVDHHQTDEKKETQKDIVNDALIIYHGYNSKTCVAITLVEMDKFFSGHDIHAFHDRFRVAEPNKVLMDELNQLIDVFKTDIHQIITEHDIPSDTCKALRKI